MKTHTTTRQTHNARTRWPEPLGPAPERNTARPAFSIPDRATGHDFLIINPRPDLEEPPPPPDDLNFYNIDFP